MTNKKLLSTVFFLLLLLFGLVTAVILVQRRVFFWPRAVEVGKVSYENSYVFASPLSARADGQERIRITVFVLDTEGRGVEGQPVFLGQDERLSLSPVQAVTDDLGRAIFDLAAFSAADYLIEARVNNRVLLQRVKVSFR